MDLNDDDFEVDLTIADLLTYLKVLELGSQQAAAKALGIHQATVSRRVERVQDHFRVRLFEDSPGRPLELSSAGAQVAKRVREALGLLAPMAGPRAKPRELCIAFSGSVRAILVEALQQTEPTFPFKLRESTGAEFRQLFARGAVDVCLAFDLNTDRNDHSDVVRRFVGSQQLALVLPAERAHLHADPVRALEGLARTYISPDLLPGYNEAIQEWLEKNGIADRAEPEGDVRTASELFGKVSLNHYGFLPRLCSSVAGKGVAFVDAPGITYRSRLYFYVHRDMQEKFNPLYENLKKVCSTYEPAP